MSKTNPDSLISNVINCNPQPPTPILLFLLFSTSSTAIPNHPHPFPPPLSLPTLAQPLKPSIVELCTGHPPQLRTRCASKSERRVGKVPILRGGLRIHWSPASRSSERVFRHATGAVRQHGRRGSGFRGHAVWAGGLSVGVRPLRGFVLHLLSFPWFRL